MTRLHATILIFLLLVALFIVGRKVFLDLYQKGAFQQEYSKVPDLYVEMHFGNNNIDEKPYKQIIKAKLLHYDWLYNGQNEVYGEQAQNLKDIEFTKDETMYVIQNTVYRKDGRIYSLWPSYHLYTEPKYLMINTTQVALNNKFNPRQNYNPNNPQIFNREYTEKETVNVSGSNSIRIENWLYNTTYIKQGYAQYGMKVIYFGCDPLVVKDYIDCNTTDNEKVKQILSKLYFAEHLKDAWIEGTTLNIKYEYFVNDYESGAVQPNNLLIFACLNNIDKIVYTAEHTKTTILKYDENSSNPNIPTTEYGELDKLEFKRDEFEKVYGITLEDIKDYIERSGK